MTDAQFTQLISAINNLASAVGWCALWLFLLLCFKNMSK